MRLGKLTNEQLDRLILSKFTHMRQEVKCSPRIGIDCTAVELGGRLAVLSTDPITSADADLGRLTVHVSCNDAAAAGAEPIGLLVTLLIPPSAAEEEVDRVANDLAEAAMQANVEIVGGHTEVTNSVTRMITSATVIAKAGENGIITPAGMQPGDYIVLTKGAGLEGTAVIAADFPERLDLTEEELREARLLMEDVSVVREGLYAADNGAHAMHDVTEGGVLSAAHEMAEASGVGMVIELGDIPLHPLTERMAKRLGIDPYRLLSSGSMLIACPDGAAMVKGLLEIGVSSAVIGRATERGDGVYLSDGSPVDPPGADELYKLF